MPVRWKRNRTVRIEASQTATLPEAHRTCKTAQQGRVATGLAGRDGAAEPGLGCQPHTMGFQ